MSGTTLPILLAVLGIIAGLAAHRGVRRGGSRFYALERDLMLRRANFYMLASIFLLVTSVGLLVYNQRQMEEAGVTGEDSAETAAGASSATLAPATPTPIVVENQPPTLEPLATADPNLPTPTPTPIIRRGVVDGTGGSGVYLREDPGTNTADLLILNDGDIVTILDEVEPIEANGYTWLKVRTIAGVEGWIADFFLIIQQRQP